MYCTHVVHMCVYHHLQLSHDCDLMQHRQLFVDTFVLSFQFDKPPKTC